MSKGSKSRITNRSLYRENFDKIDWGKSLDVPQRIGYTLPCDNQKPESLREPKAPCPSADTPA